MSENADTDIVIYQQRYETWRYLDRLRWQIVQFLIAGVTGVIAIFGYIRAENYSWMYLAGGFFLIAVSLVMLKVNSGIRANGKVLHEVGVRIGDSDIPDVSHEDRSVDHWIAVILLISGFLSIGFGLLSLANE